MYLIPLDNDAIYYNFTYFDASSLATIVLLAVAYHPSYNNLLYLLYGCTSLAAYGKTYGNINIMVRDMAAKQFLQNSTIYQNIQCNTQCEIEVTENLFLIESQSYIAIYRLYTDQLIDVSSPVTIQGKQGTSSITGITRQADIYKNKYVISTVGAFTFGDVISTNVTTVFSVISDLNSTNILFVGIGESWSFVVVNSTNVSIIIYYCGVACIFDGTFGNFSNINKVKIATNTSITQSYRLYQGAQTSESNITNAFIFVGIGNGVSRKYFVNQSTYQLAMVATYRSEPFSSANSDQYLVFGSALINRYFAYSTAEQDLQYFFFSYSVEQVAISQDSAVLAISTAANNWNVKQYQIVTDCAQYATNITNTTDITLFCCCYRYNNNNFCADADTSRSNFSGSFPIGAVVGAVVGVVMIAVSAIVVKKNYKRCLKRSRTPWKYNPVELMSFEV